MLKGQLYEIRPDIKLKLKFAQIKIFLVLIMLGKKFDLAVLKRLLQYS